MDFIKYFEVNSKSHAYAILSAVILIVNLPFESTQAQEQAIAPVVEEVVLNGEIYEVQFSDQIIFQNAQIIYPRSVNSSGSSPSQISSSEESINSTDTLDYCEEEEVLSRQVLRYGAGDRLIIPMPLSTPNAELGMATVQAEPGTDLIVFSEQCPGDSLPIEFYDDGSGSSDVRTKPIHEWGHGSVIRFRGYFDFGSINLEGDYNEPLSFILLDGIGMVYLHGSGVVNHENGTTSNFP